MASKAQVNAWRAVLPQCDYGVTYSYSTNFDFDLLQVYKRANVETRRLGGEYGWRPVAFAMFVAERLNVKLTDLEWEPVRYTNRGKANVAVGIPVLNGRWDTLHMLHITDSDRRALVSEGRESRFELPSPISPVEILRYATGGNKISVHQRSAIEDVSSESGDAGTGTGLGEGCGASSDASVSGCAGSSSVLVEGSLDFGELQVADEDWDADGPIMAVELLHLDQHSFSIWEVVEVRDGETFTVTRRLKSFPWRIVIYLLTGLLTLSLAAPAAVDFPMVLANWRARDHFCENVSRHEPLGLTPPDFAHIPCGFHGKIDIVCNHHPGICYYAMRAWSVYTRVTQWCVYANEQIGALFNVLLVFLFGIHRHFQRFLSPALKKRAAQLRQVRGEGKDLEAFTQTSLAADEALLQQLAGSRGPTTRLAKVAAPKVPRVSEERSQAKMTLDNFCSKTFGRRRNKPGSKISFLYPVRDLTQKAEAVARTFLTGTRTMLLLHGTTSVPACLMQMEAASVTMIEVVADKAPATCAKTLAMRYWSPDARKQDGKYMVQGLLMSVQRPPSLRAWRSRRAQGESEPTAEAPKQQAQQVKQSLLQLQEEVKQLQDLMEEDAHELASSMQTIRSELRAQRAARERSHPQGDEGRPNISGTGLPTCVAAVAQATAVDAQPGECLEMKPLPKGLLFRLQRGQDRDGDKFAPELCEWLFGATALACGSVCRGWAAALHQGDGCRIWPHVTLDVRRRGLRQASWSGISWRHVRSLSIYGATDKAMVRMALLPAEVKSGAAVSLECIRFRCSGLGRAAAVQKRNEFGDRMGLGDSGAALVFTLALQLSSLRMLDLAWNHLCDASLALLAKSWPPTLCSLCLEWNGIGEEGARHLSTALAQPNMLQTLDLRSNPLADAGVLCICQAVASQPSSPLKWLGLGETLLTDRGAKLAVQALQLHQHLAGLDLGENVITDAACPALAAFIQWSPRLRTLLLRGYLFEPQRVSDIGGQVLARALSSKRSFELELDYQQVACKTAVALAECSSSWAKVSLFNTDVSTLGALTLANAFRGGRASAEGKWLNVAQCRIAPSSIKLLQQASFRRLDSHGQRSR
ncbi:Nlrc3 [Symbiodinium sp. KB8]|nr:Nlrc3 [Symbiodinium sp. KB8]